MAFLGPPVRWPDVLGLSVTFDKVALDVRNALPAPLNTLPSTVVTSVILTICLIVAISLFSATLNARRASLIPASSSATSLPPRRKPGQELTALLVGPEQAGKSSIYSALVFDAVPETQTSQHPNETRLSLVGSKEGTQVAPSQTQLRLVDLPGHPRIRSAKLGDYLPAADKLVFCIDTASAIRGGTSKNDVLVEAVDQFHATLTMLARLRLSRSASKGPVPPSLMILFTRGDLSPLLATSPFDAKRQAQVVARARASFEAELGRRRAGMGLGRGSAQQARAKVGSMSKVVGGPAAAQSWLNAFKALFGLGSTSRAGAADAVDDEDDDEEAVDYVDWSWAQRAAAGSSQQGSEVSGSSSSFSLDRLDGDVVMGGKAAFAVASVGKERGWALQEHSAEGGHAPTEGLKALRAWLADPEA